MRLMKLYTGTGDDGTTGLFSGDRLGKDHPRIEAYGTVDELNSALGLAAAATDQSTETGARTHEILTELQSRLFDMGADLATPVGAGTEARIDRISDEHVATAEQIIDEVEAGNDELRAFVLPGGTELAARLHVARGICRRAERRMVALARVQPVTGQAIRYMNRVGDLLFAMARRANKDAGVKDVPWRGAKG